MPAKENQPAKPPKWHPPTWAIAACGLVTIVIGGVLSHAGV